jgi:LDH2 family malate/lactate/ureidoglycolate dehydrogenase
LFLVGTVVVSIAPGMPTFLLGRILIGAAIGVASFMVRPETGAYKGFGLGLLVEVLAALVPGAGMGPEPEALNGTGRPSGRDDDVGLFLLAVAPERLRAADGYAGDAGTLFGTLLACPPVDEDAPVRYPGLLEAERAAENLRDGVPLPAPIHAELGEVATELGITPLSGGTS